MPARNTRPSRTALTPEAGPLRIFNYDSYVSPDVVAAFEEKYGVKVEITTFTTDDEAIAKLASGAIDIDLASQRGDRRRLYKLVDTGLIQPLNKSYLTNIGNVVASLRDPYYDKGARTPFPTRCSAPASAFVPTASTRPLSRGTRCGTPNTKASRRCSTTCARDWRWRCCARV